MNTLVITVFPEGIRAVEYYCHDDVKYVESFNNWLDLLTVLGPYFSGYASIEVKSA